MTKPTSPSDADRPASADADADAAVLSDASEPVPADVAAMGYEQARDALVDVVRQLEAGSATLEQSLALWERGEALARHCEARLAGARRRLDAVSGRPAPD